MVTNRTQFTLPYLIAAVTMTVAPTLLFLAASAALVAVTGPAPARGEDMPRPQAAAPAAVASAPQAVAGAADQRRIEIRGGASADMTDSLGRPVRLTFSRVISDGTCAPRARACRPSAPVVEIRAEFAGGRSQVYRLSSAAHLGAPVVPVQGRFLAFGELVMPPRDMSSGNRRPGLDAHVLRLTLTP
ncbi:hypothetical protein [Phreatobacter sp.]|uniref:hypothetical protein n=1 Tax=Phreatobacter sp. TaxID=1966341 RepID=UPI003F6EA400